MKRRSHSAVISRRETLSVWLTIGGIFVGLTLVLWLLQRDYSEPLQPEVVPAADFTLRISDLAEGELQVFAFPIDEDTTAPFFIQRGAGDSVRVAFAACRRCFDEGITQRGNQLLCRHCRRPMRRLGPSEDPSSEPDCTEIPLPHDVEDGNVIVAQAVIRQEFRRWFEHVNHE